VRAAGGPPLPQLYAVQRLADGTWLVRTLMGDPILPAVDVVAVVGAPTTFSRP